MERHRLSRHVHERRIQSTVSITENHKFNPSLMLPMADLSGLSLNRRNSRQVHEHFGHFYQKRFKRNRNLRHFVQKCQFGAKFDYFFQSTSDYESISLNQTASLFETASITNSSIVTNSFISNSECGHDVDVDVDDVEMSDIDVTDVSPDVPKRVSISNPIPRLNEIVGFRIGQLTNQR